MVFDELLISAIREDIVAKSGLRMQSFADCTSFCILLERERLSLSSYTIARIFGIIKTNSKPYNSSIAILVNYLGHSTIYEYINNKFNNPQFNIAGQFPLYVNNNPPFGEGVPLQIYSISANSVRPIDISKYPINDLASLCPEKLLVIVLE